MARAARTGPVAVRLASATGLAVAAWLTLLGGSPVMSRETKPVPRTAILCAYEPEWQALLPSITDRKDQIIAGTVYVTGRIASADVVLVETGISMINATMAAQTVLDRFDVARLVVMGIAGGVDPALHIGDVVIPDQWSEYLESVFARDDHGTYKLPSFSDPTTTHFGMIFPEPVEVNRAPRPPQHMTWFPVDAAMLDVARGVSNETTLEACDAAKACLSPLPRVVVGGNGVSGQSFVDNAPFRAFARTTFAARAIDMESAAVAHVAYANGKPFIAIRSLSDLAGGDADATKMKVFEALASHNAALVLEALLAHLH